MNKIVVEPGTSIRGKGEKYYIILKVISGNYY